MAQLAQEDGHNLATSLTIGEQRAHDIYSSIYMYIYGDNYRHYKE